MSILETLQSALHTTKKVPEGITPEPPAYAKPGDTVNDLLSGQAVALTAETAEAHNKLVDAFVQTGKLPTPPKKS